VIAAFSCIQTVVAGAEIIILDVHHHHENLNALAIDGWVYIEIRKGMYGLKQS
jgi:hypothetical protein